MRVLSALFPAAAAALGEQAEEAQHVLVVNGGGVADALADSLSGSASPRPPNAFIAFQSGLELAEEVR